jgi:hypothetical protein
MQANTIAIERAFELAKTGRYLTVEEIRTGCWLRAILPTPSLGLSSPANLKLSSRQRERRDDPSLHGY